MIILMHTCEEVLTTNTARLAAKALTNSEVRIHCRRDERMSSDGLVQPGRPSLLLYPSSSAVELSTGSDEKSRSSQRSEKPSELQSDDGK